MVFLEAAAAGLAVIASEGPRLPHLPELLDPRGYIAVNRSVGTAGAQQGAFVRALQTLARDRARARSMGLANLRHTSHGASSLTRRNRAWRQVYDEARDGAGRAVLTERHMVLAAGPDVARMSSDRLSRAIEQHVNRPSPF